MKILITGGTGFIGQHVVRQRLAEGDDIYCLTRSLGKASALFQGKVTEIRSLSEVNGLGIDAIINLAGEPILDKRWSTARKQLLRDSRVGFTRSVIEWIAAQKRKPSVLISGSAIGYYGSQLDEVLDEGSLCSPGFTHQLCSDWEEAALKAADMGVRVCLLRTGIVLGDGGALAKMKRPFKLCLGGPIGSGDQWMSWIHIDDEVSIIETLLANDHLSGAFNLTASAAVTNREFSSCLSEVLHRPAFITMPAFVMSLLIGEGAELLVEGQRVFPKKLLDNGYKFKYPTLKEALLSIVADEKN